MSGCSGMIRFGIINFWPTISAREIQLQKKTIQLQLRDLDVQASSPAQTGLLAG